MKRQGMALAALVLLTFAGVDAAQKVLPRNDAAKEPGLAEVCQQIRRAVDARDARELLPVLAPEVVVDTEQTGGTSRARMCPTSSRNGPRKNSGILARCA